ncbi:MAG: hypothetical protein WBN72_11605 [Nitrososphaeraceae archaeon]
MSSNVITNRTVKPYMKAHDFYPGVKLEEECFSKTIIKDMNESPSRKKKGKSDLDEEPMTWPREKSGKETAYERFLEEVINPKTGEFYPQKDKDNTAVKYTGATYYITDIYRIRRADGSEYLYSKGRVDAFNSLGDPISHSISKSEIWTKTNFSYKTEFNDKTNQLEKVLQGPSGSEEIYTMPFNKENLKELYDRRQNENLNFVIKDEQTGKPFQVKDVNSQKTFELFQKPFEFLYNAEYLSPQVKAELRQAAVADGLIGGNISDYQPPSSSTSTAKNTYG